MDVSGENNEDVSQGIVRQRLLSDGTRIGQPYNDDDDIEDIKGEGCRVTASIEVTKVAGNIHLAVGGVRHKHVPKENTSGGAPLRQYRTRKHVHKFQLHQMRSFDAAHTIHALAFGQRFQGQADPLAGVTASLEDVAHYQYFVKVTPTTYTAVAGDALNSNQYTVAEKHTLIAAGSPTQGSEIPGIFFIYDFSPFRVERIEYRRSLLSFVVSLCAILGGTVTVVGMAYAVARAAKDRCSRLPMPRGAHEYAPIAGDSIQE